jgi:hypothetical protein
LEKTKNTTLRYRLVLFAAAIVLLLNCGEESLQEPDDFDGGNSIDSIPPAAITRLIVKSPTPKSLVLVWTAPGDDGNKGTAKEYDIRYASQPFTEQNWDTLIQYHGEPAPKPAGQPEAVRIGDLDPSTAYYFGIKSRDDEGHESALSNIATEMTLQETQPPARIDSLRVEAVDLDTFELTWIAPGDDGVFGRATEYDVRYSKSPITDSNWELNSRVSSVPAPKEAGLTEVLRVDGVDGEDTYYFAIKTADDVPNWSPISNVPFVVGGRVELFLPVDQVYAGEELSIYFRGPEAGTVSIRVHRLSTMGECAPAGTHPLVYADIINHKKFPAGLHSVTFDFRYTDTGELLPSSFYYIVMCWDITVRQVEGISFTNDP